MASRKKMKKVAATIDLTVSDNEDNIEVNESRSRKSLKKCQSYTTSNNTDVEIDDRKLIISSTSKTFHSKYTVSKCIFESIRCNVFLGINKLPSSAVVIKRMGFTTNYRNYMKGNVPKEVFIQKKAEQVSVENGKGTVLKVLGWYVYTNYIIIITEFDIDFYDLRHCTQKQPNERFSEENCKTIFKLLLQLILKLNQKGIFHLDLKPQNVLYNEKCQSIKLIDFGHAISVKPGENPKIRTSCGTKRLQTPEYVKKESCCGAELDMWGIAQTVFFCLQGSLAFKNNDEVIKKELEFKVDITQNCKDLLTRMLAKKAEDRITPQEILSHPWVKTL